MSELKMKMADLVSDSVHSIFINGHSMANTKSGDISCEQLLRLNKIERELTELVMEQVEQNQYVTFELPLSQRNLIQRALEYYVEQSNHFNKNHCSDQVAYDNFDMTQLRALLHSKTEITISKNDLDSFCAVHGIDYPTYLD